MGKSGRLVVAFYGGREYREPDLLVLDPRVHFAEAYQIASSTKIVENQDYILKN